MQLPEGTTINNIFREKRTKRVQLVMQPSKFNQMKEHCQQENISVNDFINTLINNYFNKKNNEIKGYIFNISLYFIPKIDKRQQVQQN